MTNRSRLQLEPLEKRMLLSGDTLGTTVLRSFTSLGTALAGAPTGGMPDQSDGGSRLISTLFPSSRTLVPLPVGSHSSSAAVADLNDDGRPDIVLTHADGNTMSPLPSNGNSTFALRQIFAVGSEPVSAAVTDLNGDGLLDLVVVNARSNTVSVLLGRGNGTFAAQQTFAVGDNLTSPDTDNLVVALSDGTLEMLPSTGTEDPAPVLNFAFQLASNLSDLQGLTIGTGGLQVLVTNAGNNSLFLFASQTQPGPGRPPSPTSTDTEIPPVPAGTPAPPPAWTPAPPPLPAAVEPFPLPGTERMPGRSTLSPGLTSPTPIVEFNPPAPIAPRRSSEPAPVPRLGPADLPSGPRAAPVVASSATTASPLPYTPALIATLEARPLSPNDLPAGGASRASPLLPPAGTGNTRTDNHDRVPLAPRPEADSDLGVPPDEALRNRDLDRPPHPLEDPQSRLEATPTEATPRHSLPGPVECERLADAVLVLSPAEGDGERMGLTAAAVAGLLAGMADWRRTEKPRPRPRRQGREGPCPASEVPHAFP
jgi:hypothetical protein